MCSIHLITLIINFSAIRKRLNQSVDELPQTRIDQTKLMIDADDEHTNTKTWMAQEVSHHKHVHLTVAATNA